MVRGTTLFDGTRTVEAATITIDGEKIVAVGQHRPPPGAEVIELGDATLVPGLVDCHQHLCFESLSEDAADADPDALVEQARRSARRALAAGVTTVRDLGDKSYVSLPLRHEHDLPTLLCAGPPITTPNGHCWYLGGEVDPSGGESALRAAVRERVERGCDVVKIMMTGGFLTPTNPMWESQFSLDDLRHRRRRGSSPRTSGGGALPRRRRHRTRGSGAGGHHRALLVPGREPRRERDRGTARARRTTP